ncbi:MAG: LuxE/PaaK family acyltransferase [Limisphaerales bacterium]
MTHELTFAEYSVRLREFMREETTDFTRPPADRPSVRRFNQLALELFALQFRHNEPYRRFCRARMVTPETARDWMQIPAIPTAAFKELELTSLPAAERTAVFHSSGTTAQRPSRHFHNAESLAIYDASLLSWFNKRGLACMFHTRTGGTGDSPVPSGDPPLGRECRGKQPVAVEYRTRLAVSSGRWPDDTGQWPVLPRPCEISGLDDPGTTGWRLCCLTPSPALAPHSSLVHMLEVVRRDLGAPAAAFVGRLDATGAWTLDTEAAIDALQQAADAHEPMLILGTAFSFVHLLDALTERGLGFQLPAGSRVMETGGYKGRSRTMSKTELHALITQRLGILPANIVCEYGMSELSSQAYDRAVDARRNADIGKGSAQRIFHFPPWARVQIISPETGKAVADGETGLIRVCDLANVRSVMAIQTEDLGIRRGDGFELIGRATQAEPRGCSLMTH